MTPSRTSSPSTTAMSVAHSNDPPGADGAPRPRSAREPPAAPRGRSARQRCRRRPACRSDPWPLEPRPGGGRLSRLPEGSRDVERREDPDGPAVCVDDDKVRRSVLGHQLCARWTVSSGSIMSARWPLSRRRSARRDHGHSQPQRDRGRRRCPERPGVPGSSVTTTQWTRWLAMSSATRASEACLGHVRTPSCIAAETRMRADAGSAPRWFDTLAVFTGAPSSSIRGPSIALERRRRVSERTDRRVENYVLVRSSRLSRSSGVSVRWRRTGMWSNVDEVNERRCTSRPNQC